MAATKRITANARAVGGSAKFIAYAIITLVVLYSDIMFVSLMWSAFPGGFLTVAAIGGAFATGISVIALVIGKSHWFRPGNQLVFAWCFTFVELAVSIMNVVVSVMAARSESLGYLSVYLIIAPATPLVALIGWVIVLYMDKERQNLHENMEMEDDMADAERDHRRNVHAARMDIKATALEQQREYLKMHLSSADVQQVLSEGSYEIARGIVSEIVQRPIMPKVAVAPVAPALALPNRQTVESDNPRGLAKVMAKINPGAAQQAPVPAPSAKVTAPRPFLPAAKKKLPPMHHARKKNRGSYVVNPPAAAMSLANEKKPAIPIKDEAEKTYKVNKPAPKLHLND